MGTTADKLNKVLETKEAIRTAINNKGGTLTETDTFASYATAIDNIQSGSTNEPITITQNGTYTAPDGVGYSPINVNVPSKEEETKSITANEGVLVMATNATFPPYEYKDGDDFAGIDVEIAGKIAEKLGLKLEIQDVEFGSIIGGVQTGKFDIGMAGMTVTDERKQSVNFTNTYAKAKQVVIVKEGSAIKSLDDLKGDGSMKYGVQQDTTGDIYASDTAENGGYGEENVIRYKTGAEAIEALKADKVQAVIIDNEPAKSFVEANEGLTILDGAWVEEEYAIAISKDNEELLNKINAALEELTADGTIQQIVDKYIPAK